MKTVVFGGAGFLGSHVADALSDAGHSVTVADIAPSSFLRPDQHMMVVDILSKEDVARACRGADYVYNFAGLADINIAKHRPFQTAQLNILGNINILDACVENMVKRFLFASTIYVYSESGSFYRASKQASENFVELYKERFDLNFTILRYGSLYGRRSDDRNAIHRFVRSALEKGEIHYNGTGEELREYIHAVDAASASVKVLEKEFANQHVTITGHQPYRVKDVMVMITEMLQSQIRVNFDQTPAEAHYNVTPYAYRPKLGKKFVVNPFVDFGQGVLDCIHEIEEKKNVR
jgi:UDP-glucose 4-epimerase